MPMPLVGPAPMSMASALGGIVIVLGSGMMVEGVEGFVWLCELEDEGKCFAIGIAPRYVMVVKTRARALILDEEVYVRWCTG